MYDAENVAFKFSRLRKHLKLQLHGAILRLRLSSNSLIHVLSLSNSHNNVASIQKNRGDKSYRVIVALCPPVRGHYQLNKEILKNC